MSSVEVTTGARLHFGLLCGSQETGGRYAGIGMILQDPGWRLVVRAADSCKYESSEPEMKRRVLALSAQVCRMTGLSGIAVTVRDSMPLHVGLGAGTQLALAVATAARIAAGQPRQACSLELAGQLGRARRSAIGTIGFDRGGFVADGGVTAGGDTRRIRRIGFPESWRVVVVCSSDVRGLSGSREEIVFRQDLRMPEAVVEQQRLLVSESIMPSIERVDFAGFQSALAEYGRSAGEFFSRQQGGVYSSQTIARLCGLPEFRRLHPVQSSWGPAVAVFAESQEQAELHCRNISASSIAAGLHCRVTQGQNHGATVRSVAPEQPGHVVRG